MPQKRRTTIFNEQAAIKRRIREIEEKQARRGPTNYADLDDRASDAAIRTLLLLALERHAPKR